MHGTNGKFYQVNNLLMCRAESDKHTGLCSLPCPTAIGRQYNPAVIITTPRCFDVVNESPAWPFVVSSLISTFNDEIVILSRRHAGEPGGADLIVFYLGLPEVYEEMITCYICSCFAEK